VKAALFLGCTVPVRAQNYELSARQVARKLGIDLVDIDGFGCCGYPIGSVSSRAALWMAARNLALAEREGFTDLVALCSACTASIAEARIELEHDRARCEAQAALDRLGLTYSGTAGVRHFARFLYEEVGPERIAASVVRPLEKLTFAVHYGCHYLKPSRAHRGPDEPEAPHTVQALVEATGARVVSHDRALSCCGGGVLAVREGTALAMARTKLDAVMAAGAHALVSICPFCSVMYEGNQKQIEKISATAYNLPVLYLPQVLGLAFGLDPAEIGTKQNRIKPKDVLAVLGL
jgi:heterodisulfide reductase subunit B